MEFPQSKFRGTSYVQNTLSSLLMPFSWDLTVQSEQAGVRGGLGSVCWQQDTDGD